MSLEIRKLLSAAQEKSASDLHLNTNRQPVLRIDGRLRKLGDWPIITEENIQDVVKEVTTEDQRSRFVKRKELDFSYENTDLGRFRVNACMQKGMVSLAFRLLMQVLSPLSSLGLPEIYTELSLKPRGLILVTGPTGSGKSTSMAAMIHHINLTQEKYIITIEDPIEYVHKDDKSVIIQRNVGEDTESFAAALKYSLRHDPDVIVVGEMRDLTTIATAISAAETGHLVFGTLHTLDAAETLHRIVEVFPEGQQSQVKLQLSQVLLAVLSQTLVPRIGGGRVPACEIMIGNVAIRNLMREGHIHQIQSSIQLHQNEGMQTLNHALANLITGGLVTAEDAMEKSSNPVQLEEMLKHRKPSTLDPLAKLFR